MIVAHAQIEIGAPIERVFDYVADARNEPEWLPGAREVEKVTEGAIASGARFEGTYARAGRVTIELVAFDRPERLTLRGRSKIVAFDDTVTLSDRGGLTKLVARLTAEPRGLMRLVAPLMGRTMRRQFEENWIHLKSALESGGTGAREVPSD